MSVKPTLVILAAGMASRYGSMKQTEGFGPCGETIMEYSIYDAIKTGFGKVVFIIREAFSESFKSIFEPKLAGKIETEYVYQEFNRFTNNFEFASNRVKPLGTGHAVLCTKNAVHTPFVVINADDFYGYEAFETAASFFKHSKPEESALVAFEIQNTLSENGTVNRGICKVDDKGKLISVTERFFIERKDGKVVFVDNDITYNLEDNAPVSMNFWCFKHHIFDHAQQLFETFLAEKGKEEKSEFFINTIVDDVIKTNVTTFDVLKSSQKWFGVTYKEDAPSVKTTLEQLIADGKYPNSLWK